MDRQIQAPQLPPVVRQVFDQFVEEMRNDPEIDGETLDRLEALFFDGDVPRPEDLDEALYGLPLEGQP
jgi:hypothetical protein